jgi:hypothetical protein
MFADKLFEKVLRFQKNRLTFTIKIVYLYHEAAWKIRAKSK